MERKDTIKIISTDDGRDFLEKELRPKFIKAIDEKHSILIDLDDAFYFTSHFVNESFGELSRESGHDKVLEHLEIKSVKRSIRLNKIIAVLYSIKK